MVWKGGDSISYLKIGHKILALNNRFPSSLLDSNILDNREIIGTSLNTMQNPNLLRGPNNIRGNLININQIKFFRKSFKQEFTNNQ